MSFFDLIYVPDHFYVHLLQNVVAIVLVVYLVTDVVGELLAEVSPELFDRIVLFHEVIHINTVLLLLSSKTVSRQTPFICPIFSRVPMVRKPAFLCS